MSGIQMMETSPVHKLFGYLTATKSWAKNVRYLNGLAAILFLTFEYRTTIMSSIRIVTVLGSCFLGLKII